MLQRTPGTFYVLTYHRGPAPLNTALALMDTASDIDPRRWAEIPCTVGRVANETDVEEGRAVFCLEGQSEAASIPVPCCGVHVSDESLAFVVIQAEIAEVGTLLGFRYLFVGFGICQLNEVQLIPSGWPEGHEL